MIELFWVLIISVLLFCIVAGVIALGTWIGERLRKRRLHPALRRMRTDAYDNESDR